MLLRSDIGISRVAEIRNKSVRIKNLPPAAQEGLLQQVLEKIAPVKRLEVFLDKQEALLELENPAVGLFLFCSSRVSHKYVL